MTSPVNPATAMFDGYGEPAVLSLIVMLAVFEKLLGVHVGVDDAVAVAVGVSVGVFVGVGESIDPCSALFAVDTLNADPPPQFALTPIEAAATITIIVTITRMRDDDVLCMG